MDVKEIGVNTRNWVQVVQKLLGSPCECGIEPPGCISHGVSTKSAVHDFTAEMKSEA